MRNKKMIAVLVALLLVAALTVGGTLAWLNAKTTTVVNTMIAGDINITVEEDFDYNVKNNVKITNVASNGGVDTYIRVQVIATWQDNLGGVYAKAPAEQEDYKITWSGIDNETWFKKGDFYYYKNPLEPGTSTDVLFTGCQLEEGVVPPSSDYHFCVEVLASSIQTVPVSTVVDEWGVTVNEDGSISK